VSPSLRIGIHRLSLCLPFLGGFPFTVLHLPLDFIRVSSSAPIRLTVDGEFPGVGLAELGVRNCA